MFSPIGDEKDQWNEHYRDLKNELLKGTTHAVREGTMPKKALKYLQTSGTVPDMILVSQPFLAIHWTSLFCMFGIYRSINL